jgi:hypothetical protein
MNLLYYNKIKNIIYNNNLTSYCIYINLYNSLGFGNLLFIVINGLALSYEYDRQIIFCSYKPYRYDRPNINTYNIFKSLQFIKKKMINNYSEWTETDFYKYNKINLLNRHYLINGYYQSYKYSEKYIDRIKSYLFENIKDLVEKTTKQFNQLKNNKKTILIHVRRGDYTQFTTHFIIEEYYYKNSLIEFLKENNKDDYNIFLFTDDYTQIKSWNIIKDYNIQFINETNPEIIFLLMIQFDHYIIANSSLSLISYYFRNNKEATIKFPYKWVAGMTTYEDMIPDNAKGYNNIIPKNSD